MKRRRTAQVIAVVAILGLVYAYVNVRSTVGQMVMPGNMNMTGNQDHMPMLDATTPDAFTAKADALPSSGWTATASDQVSSNPASYAIDGNTATFWHSNYKPTPVPLPHSITIDMHATTMFPGSPTCLGKICPITAILASTRFRSAVTERTGAHPLLRGPGRTIRLGKPRCSVASWDDMFD